MQDFVHQPQEGFIGVFRELGFKRYRVTELGGTPAPFRV